jgi:CSLREA domain-containing protein
MFRRLRLAPLAAAVLALLAFAPSAWAGTIRVNTATDEFNTAGDCSLREAVEFANDDITPRGCTDSDPTIEPDTIILEGGDYNLTRNVPTDSGVEGAGVGDLDVHESLIIQGAGSGITGIDANGPTDTHDRAIDVDAGALTISGLKIHDGSAEGGGNPGGGIYLHGAASSLDLTDVRLFDNNAVGDGGAISSIAPLTLDDSEVVGNNSTAGAGGGVSGPIAPTDTVLTNTLVSGNSAAGIGGGLDVGDTQITSSTIRNNSSSGNGGGVRAGGTADITTTLISSNSSALNNGGGLFANGASVTDSTVEGNTAIGVGALGGGIWSNTSATLTNTDVQGNKAGGNGGGVFVNNNAGLTDSLIRENQSVAGDGGGIFSNNTVSLITSTVRNNLAPGGNGGGIVGTGTITDSTLRQNSTGGLGGGIYVPSSGGVTFAVVRSTIAGNDANHGGGIYFSDNGGNQNLSNATIAGNKALANGGGVYTGQGTTSLNNVTVNRNVADADSNGGGDGGGVYRIDPATATVENTIIAGNLDMGTQANDCSGGGSITSAGHNLVGINDGCSIVATSTDQFGTLISPINPRLGLLNDNGGPTLTEALLSGSPAINAGDDTSCETVDQRGIDRSLGGNHCDLGAYEVVQCRGFAVTRLGTSGADNLSGTSGRDVFLGLGGADTISGGRGNDVACGGTGNDVIKGGRGSDSLYGEDGNDTLNGGRGSGDLCVGGPGVDTRINCEGA